MKGAKPKSNAIRRGSQDSHGLAATAQEKGVQMPEEIAANPVQAKIWGWICPPVNNFTPQDIPALKQLCMWHGVFLQAQQSISSPNGDGLIAIYEKVGEVIEGEGENAKVRQLVKKHPAIGIMKEASAEIRALSDMLGLSPLARSRIGLMDATTVKTAADTALMFRSIDAAYGLEEPIEIDGHYEED